MTQPLLNSETLDSLRELQSPEDPTFLKDYLTTFYNAIPALLASIEAAIQKSDSLKLEKSAHAIKSSCLNVGATELVLVCAELEKLGKQHTVSGAQDLYLKAKSLCDQLKAEIYALPELK